MPMGDFMVLLEWQGLTQIYRAQVLEFRGETVQKPMVWTGTYVQVQRASPFFAATLLALNSLSICGSSTL